MEGMFNVLIVNSQHSGAAIKLVYSSIRVLSINAFGVNTNMVSLVPHGLSQTAKVTYWITQIEGNFAL